MAHNNLAENTIVIFTSDHGDLMGEHHKHDKGNLYEASAKVPFVLRYPNKVKAGKVIRKANTSTDFAPKILGLMDAPSIKGIAGLDASSDFNSKKKELVDEHITYIKSSSQSWIAAVNNRYKLVLSVSEKPWLLDQEKNPDEEINCYNNPKYQQIARKMQSELLKQAKQNNDPVLSAKKALVY